MKEVVKWKFITIVRDSATGVETVLGDPKGSVHQEDDTEDEAAGTPAGSAAATSSAPVAVKDLGSAKAEASPPRAGVTGRLVRPPASVGGLGCMGVSLQGVGRGWGVARQGVGSGWVPVLHAVCGACRESFIVRFPLSLPRTQVHLENKGGHFKVKGTQGARTRASSASPKRGSGSGARKRASSSPLTQARPPAEPELPTVRLLSGQDSAWGVENIRRELPDGEHVSVVSFTALSDRLVDWEIAGCTGHSGFVQNMCAEHAKLDKVLRDFLAAMAAQMKQGRPHLNLACVCKHGKHRSVAMAELLAYGLRSRGWHVQVCHTSASCTRSPCTCRDYLRSGGYCGLVKWRSWGDQTRADAIAERSRELCTWAEWKVAQRLLELNELRAEEEQLPMGRLER